MEDRDPKSTAYEFIEQLRKQARVQFIGSFVMIFIGAAFVYIAFMGLENAKELRELNSSITIINTESAKDLSELIEAKQDLLRVEIQQSRSIELLFGGIFMGLGLAGLALKRRNEKKIEFIQALVSLAERNS